MATTSSISDSWAPEFDRLARILFAVNKELEEDIKFIAGKTLDRFEEAVAKWSEEVMDDVARTGTTMDLSWVRVFGEVEA